MAEAEERITMIEELRAGMTNLHMIFIVIELGEPRVTRRGQTVRTARVGDASACVNLSLWDEPGALIQEGDIVRLRRGYASPWHGALTLYAGKEGELQKVDEFCMLFNEEVNMSEPAGPPSPPPQRSERQFSARHQYAEYDHWPAYRGRGRARYGCRGRG